MSFKGEQHGFRKAENMKFCLDGEFYFYSRVFTFDASGPDVDVSNSHVILVCLYSVVFDFCYLLEATEERFVGHLIELRYPFYAWLDHFWHVLILI